MNLAVSWHAIDIGRGIDTSRGTPRHYKKLKT